MHIQAAFFPTYYGWLDSASLCAEQRLEFEARLTRGLEAAQDSHAKWNQARWQEPRHLLGLLCHEERRQWVACLILLLYHLKDELVQALQSGAAVAPRRNRARGGRVWTAASAWAYDQPDEIREIFERMDAADLELKDSFFKVGKPELMNLLYFKNFTEPGRDPVLLPVVRRELLLLASLPPRDTRSDPLLSSRHTPFIHRELVELLFVGCAHNLPVEAYVSRVANLNKIHSGLKPVQLSAMFMYKVRLEPEKEQRRSAHLRVLARARPRGDQQTGGVLKKESCNKEQLRLLIEQALARANAVQGRREEYFARGEQCLGRRVRAARSASKARTERVAGRIVGELRRSSKVGPNGGARKRPLSRKECLHYLPKDLDDSSKGRRGNRFKDPNPKKAGGEAVREGRQEERKTAKRLKRKKPLTARQRVAAEQLYDGEERAAKRQRVAAARQKDAGGDEAAAGGDEAAAGRQRPQRLAAKAAQLAGARAHPPLH